MQSFEPIDIEIIYKNHIPFNIKIKNKFVHSNFDPYKEAQRQIQSINLNKNSNTNIICFKIGLGYVIEQLLLFNYHKIIWIEPEEIIKKKAIERLIHIFPDFIELLDKKIEFHNNLLEYIKQISTSKIILSFELIFLKSYLNKEDLISIDLFYRKRFYFQVNYNTAKKFEQVWISNFYKNISIAKNFLPINVLKKRFFNYPAIIVAGGPSLDKWFPYIKKVQEHFIIIAVDTSLNTLIKNEIIPDIVISVDAQIINYLHLEGNLSKIRFLVADPAVYYLTIKNFLNYNHYIFFYNNSIPFVSYILNKIYSNIDFIKSGGSVSTNALDLSHYLGCNPIYFTGLDFGFPENIIHTKFSVIESRMLYVIDRTKTLENFNYNQINSIKKKYGFNLENERVTTNDKLLIFKNWFEKNYNLYHEVQLYILYGKGCKILHFDFLKTPEEFLSKVNYKINKRNLFDESIKQIESKNISLDVISIIKNIYNNLYLLLKDIENIISVLNILINSNSIDNSVFENFQLLEKKIFSYEELKMLTDLNFNFLTSKNIIDNLKHSYEIYLRIKENIYVHLKLLSSIHRSEF